MFLKFFKRKNSSANVAKERLQVILAYERVSNKAPFLDDLRKDIINVISKYITIDPATIKVNVERNNSIEVLEINIPIK